MLPATKRVWLSTNFPRPARTTGTQSPSGHSYETDRSPNVNDTMQAEPIPAKPLYETDPYAWSIEQARLLREGRLDEIDAVNVADEILSVGKQQVFALEESLIAIIKHMLIWKRQPSQRSPDRTKAISEHRRAAEETLRASPSLRSELDNALQWSFSIARLQASSETDTDLADFPESCPYDWTTIMTRALEPDEKSG